MITLAPGPLPDGFSITADELRPRAIIRHGSTILRLELRGEQYDITIADPFEKGALCVFMMFDDLTPDRQTALARFWNAIKGKPVPGDPRVTLQRRERTAKMLRVVDARQNGATYREIAAQLFPNLKHDAETWVENPIRETTVRLARDGIAFVRGGYRNLLRLPRRSR